MQLCVVWDLSALFFRNEAKESPCRDLKLQEIWIIVKSLFSQYFRSKFRSIFDFCSFSHTLHQSAHSSGSMSKQIQNQTTQHFHQYPTSPSHHRFFFPEGSFLCDLTSHYLSNLMSCPGYLFFPLQPLALLHQTCLACPCLKSMYFPLPKTLFSRQPHDIFPHFLHFYSDVI